MYCKYCGIKQDDDAIFCSNCGEKIEMFKESNNQDYDILLSAGKKEVNTCYPKQRDVVDFGIKDTENVVVNKKNAKNKWISTDNFQWHKPIVGRFTIVIVALIILVYGIRQIVSPGEIYYFQDSVAVADAMELVSAERPYINEAMFDYRTKFALLFLLPASIFIILSFKWMRCIPWPKSNTELARDFADNIQPYIWLGFTKHKYVFIEKNGKYGLADAAQYKCVIPCLYDDIKWRYPNKTVDVKLGNGTKTLDVELSEKKETLCRDKHHRKI